MKKILFMAASSVLLVAGCQKTEIQNETLTPIGFNTHMGKLTKAPDAENAEVKANLIEQNFHVWAYFATENDLNYKAGELYLVNIVVSNDNKDGITWTTGETYYWPGKDKELDIYAISSYAEDYTLAYTVEDDSKTCNVAIDYTAHKVTVTDFVADADADNDLMIAPMIKQDQDDAKYIEPRFEHALTKVVLRFREKGESVVHVRSAKTSPIKSKATLVVTNTLPDPVAVGDPVVCSAEWKWTSEPTTTTEYLAQCKLPTVQVKDVTTAEGDQEVFYDAVLLKEAVPGASVTTYKDANGNDIPENNRQEVDGQWYMKSDLNDGTPVAGAAPLTVTTEQTVADDGFIIYGCWLLIPQDDITGYYLDVEYIVDGMLIQQRFNLDKGITSWGRNQQITYNVTISPDYIEFEPDVDEWITKEDGTTEEKEDYNS